jgi:hypothetical protein
MGPVNKNRKRHNVLEYAGQRDKTAVTWRGKGKYIILSNLEN